MKNKLLLTLLSLVCILTFSSGLVACGDNGKPSAHTHEWSQTWEKDDTHHWHNCTVSDCDITDNSQKDGYAEHDISNGDCVCGYKPGFTVGLEYRLNSYDNDESYMVQGIGTAKDTEIIIPSEYEGKPVKRIDSYAFNGCANLTSITIPDGVTAIDGRAFSGCSSLTNIAIPDSVASIGNNAFGNCNSLTSIIIPNNVTSIGFSTFEGCSSLASVKLPDNVPYICSNMFDGCTSLANITIPDGVTQIAISAFSGCTSLTNITIPDGVTVIAAGAFKDCTSLTSIIIPNAVTKIYSSAFSGCSSLTNLTIQSDETIIDGNVFDGCPIETATIPAHACSHINNSALKMVVITSGTMIYDNALKDCTNLTSITIPDTITSIGDSAFFGCKKLTDIFFNGTKEQWYSIKVGSYWSYMTGDFTVHCTSGGDIRYD